MASLAMRFVANFLDSLLWIAPFFIISLSDPEMASDYGVGPISDAVAGLGFLFLIGYWITTLLLMRKGQMSTKRLFGMRVLDGEGEPMGLFRMLFMRSLIGKIGLHMIPFYGWQTVS